VIDKNHTNYDNAVNVVNNYQSSIFVHLLRNIQLTSLADFYRCLMDNFFLKIKIKIKIFCFSLLTSLLRVCRLHHTLIFPAVLSLGDLHLINLCFFPTNYHHISVAKYKPTHPINIQKPHKTLQSQQKFLANETDNKKKINNILLHKPIRP
jgi:hypothetical protein